MSRKEEHSVSQRQQQQTFHPKNHRRRDSYWNPRRIQNPTLKFYTDRKSNETNDTTNLLHFLLLHEIRMRVVVLYLHHPDCLSCLYVAVDGVDVDGRQRQPQKSDSSSEIKIVRHQKLNFAPFHMHIAAASQWVTSDSVESSRVESHPFSFCRKHTDGRYVQPHNNIHLWWSSIHTCIVF